MEESIELELWERKLRCSKFAALNLMSPGGWDRGCVQEQTCESGGGIE